MEVFTSEFVVERQLIKDCLRLAISSILFHRLLGNLKPKSNECCGVTYPTISDNLELETQLSAKIEEFYLALTSSSTRSGRILIPFYPSPNVPPPRPTSLSSRLSQSPPAGAVSSALGWFSATSKALVKSDDEEERERERGRGGAVGQCWECWVLEVKCENGLSQGRAEERLRPQLSSHLLRLLSYVLTHPATVPPITSAGLTPFGYSILINPDLASLPFSLTLKSKSSSGEEPVEGKEMELFPVLYTSMTKGAGDASKARGIALGR